MFIFDNAFFILGLTANADDKQLGKRYKEILHLLAIGEIPSYAEDFQFIDYKLIRKQTLVNSAYTRLANNQKKIHDTFFRFQLSTTEDLGYVFMWQWKYLQAYTKWMALFKETQHYCYYKNALILWLFVYAHNKKFRGMTLDDLWLDLVKGFYDIVYNDIFRDQFVQLFNIHNATSISHDGLSNFKQILPDYLAKLFFDISMASRNHSIYINFVKQFGIQVKDISHNIMLIWYIRQIEWLLKIFQNKESPENSINYMVPLLDQIVYEINKFDDFWLSNHIKIIDIKDRCAEIIRSIAILLYNSHDDISNSYYFMEKALGIVGSGNLKQSYQEDVIYLQDQLPTSTRSFSENLINKQLNSENSWTYSSGPLPKEHIWSLFKKKKSQWQREWSQRTSQYKTEKVSENADSFDITEESLLWVVWWIAIVIIIIVRWFFL